MTNPRPEPAYLFHLRNLDDGAVMSAVAAAIWLVVLIEWVAG